MAITDNSVHYRFKLNGNSYNQERLKELGYNLIKEGTQFEQVIGNFLNDWLDEKPTLQVKTSGSTGTPKNILLQKSHMVNSALATGAYFDLVAGKKALLCLPVNYIAGKMMLVRAMVLGLELDYVAPDASPLKGLSKKYDFAAMVPLQLQNSINEIEQIKTLIVGGAAMSSALKELVRQKETEIFETYGMTETVTHIAVKKVNRVVGQRQNNFHALANVNFQIDDKNCLVINAPMVSDTAIATNDVVRLISETEFEWVGRYDNVINSGGVKLFPEEIEAKLASYISKPFFVAALPDETLGEKLILVIEDVNETNQILEELELYNHLTRFQKPKAVFSIPEFIRTETGKIQRNKTLKLLKF